MIDRQSDAWGSRSPLLVGLACVVVLFVGLSSRALWDVDEGMHAAMSKNILLSGDWVTPTLNGEPWLDKPILFSWLGAMSMSLFGLTEFAARLPGAIFGMLTVLVTYRMGRRVFDERTGLIAALVLATSVIFAVLARSVGHDIVLTFFTTGALYLFFRVEQGHGRRSVPLFWVALGLGVVTKGLLGVVLPGMVIAPYILLRRRWGVVRELRPLSGVPILLAVVSPWYMLMEARNPGYLHYFLIDQHFGNFGSDTPVHPRPFHYYLSVLFAGLFPWSTLLPLGLIRSLRSRARGDNAAGVFLAIWVVTILVFFSAASSKLTTYILPLFPAAALLIARAWHDARRAPITWSVLPFAASTMGVLVWRVFDASGVELLEYKYGVSGWKVDTIVVWLTAATTVAVLLVLARRYRAAIAALGSAVTLIVPFFAIAVAPDIDPFRSTKRLSARLDELLPPGEPGFFYHGIEDSFWFYTDRKAVDVLGQPALLEHLARPGGSYIVISRHEYPLVEPFEGRLSVVDTEGHKLLLYAGP